MDPDPDPGGPKIRGSGGSGFGSGSATLRASVLVKVKAKTGVKKYLFFQILSFMLQKNEVVMSACGQENSWSYNFDTRYVYK
jgi:hypothetical protein